MSTIHSSSGGLERYTAVEKLPYCNNHPHVWASHKVEYHGTTTYVCGWCALGFRMKPGVKVKKLKRR